jgi:dehydrogenase/reductase SDR family protein 12
MVVLREELVVQNPREQVFAFVGDFANSADWDPGVDRSRTITDGPVGVGTRYELIVRFGDRRLPMIYEVTLFDPPDRVVLRGSGATVNAVDDIRFEEADGGTRIRYTADLRLKGPFRMVEPFMSGRLRKVGSDAMAGMKEALTSQR